jgi:hypothetical protein
MTTERLILKRYIRKRERERFIKSTKIKHTFPVKPKFRGRSSVACSINFICDGAGVQVVARVPKAGPVPPPTTVVTPTHNKKFW